MEENNTKLLEIKNDNMWFLGSPVTLCSMCLELDRISGELFTRVKWSNLTNGIIDSIVFDVICFDELRKPVCRIENVSFGGVDAGRYEDFGYERKIPVPDTKIRNMEYVLRRVVYQDGSAWNNTEQTHFDRKLDQQNIYAVQGDLNKEFIDICVRSGIDGTNLVLQPVFEEDYWLCACGAFNWKDDKKCAMCRVGRSWLEKSTDRELLQKHREEHEAEIQRIRQNIAENSAVETEEKQIQRAEFEMRRTEMKEQARKQRSKARRKYLIWMAALLFALAGIAYILMTFVFPRFMQADEYEKHEGQVVEKLRADAGSECQTEAPADSVSI